MEFNKRADKVTQKQKEVLVDFMFDHIAFVRGKLLGPEGKITSGGLWQVLCQQLNSEGPEKNVAKWQRVWIDLKMNTKKKAATLAGGRRKNGGGPLEEIVLTDIEEKVLHIISKTAVFGLVCPDEIPLDSAELVEPEPSRLQNLPQEAREPEAVASTSWINMAERTENEIHNTEFVDFLSPAVSESTPIITEETPSTAPRSTPRKIFKKTSVAAEAAADFKELANGTRKAVEDVKKEICNLNKKVDKLINQYDKMITEKDKIISVLERIAVALEGQSSL